MVAISDYTKKSFLKFFPSFPQDKITVIYPSSRYEKRAKYKIPEILKKNSLPDFMLSVGTFEPRKNQRMLVDAYEIYVKRVKSPVKLVMAVAVVG